jgi:glutamate dehydrogenase
VTDAASAKFGVDQALGRSNLELRIAAVQASDAFDRIALGRTNWSINAACSALAAEALRHRGPEGVRQWLDFRVRDFDAARRTISSLASSDMTVAKAFIAADLMNDLAAGPDRVAGQRS